MLDLDDLDHLDRLDDAAPPQPDAALLSRVHRRADRRRRTNRLAVAGALVVVLAIAGGVAAVVRSRHSTTVIVTGPSALTSTSTSPSVPAVFTGPSSAGTLPNGMHVVMTLAAPAVPAGTDIPYRIELRNGTGRPQTIGQGNVDCVLGGIAPAVFDAKGKFPVDKPPLASDCKRMITLASGGLVTITGSVPIQRIGPKVGARHGHFTVMLENVLDPKVGFTPRRKLLPPIPVEINAPDLTVRIEIASDTVAANQVIRGFVVFDNAGHTTVSAGCSTQPDYAISLNTLEAGQVTAVNPAPPILNPSAPCTTTGIPLEPGTTRLPFAVTAKYYDCYPPLPKGQFLTDGPYLPTCIGSHVPPPLPAGQYRLGFTGAGALGAFVVAPVSVTVRAGPSQGRTSYP
jgi:hypothetical protein